MKNISFVFGLILCLLSAKSAKAGPVATFCGSAAFTYDASVCETSLVGDSQHLGLYSEGHLINEVVIEQQSTGFIITPKIKNGMVMEVPPCVGGRTTFKTFKAGILESSVNCLCKGM